MSTTDQFKFRKNQRVRIVESGEEGTVIGRAEYIHCTDSYLVRYKAADGRAVEQWWSVESLEEAT